MAQPDGSDNRQEFVCGLRAIREILRADSRPLSRIHVLRQDRQFSDIVRLARAKRIPVYVEPRDRLDRLVLHGRHQGIVGLVAAKGYVNEDELLDMAGAQLGPALLVVLDHVQDPQNLGAVLRTSEAAGVHGVFLPERRSVGLTDGVARASAGAIEYMPVARAHNINRLLEKIQGSGIMPIALDPGASAPYTALDLRGPVALVFGSEEQGIRRGVLSKCHERANIPMGGRIESLNVSASVAVVLFEAVRQRQEAIERAEAKEEIT